MNAFLTTVAAGVIVAVIGAILAFYFGSVRERRKQEYERKIEEEKQQEEKQMEMIEHRITALQQFLPKAHSLAKDLNALALAAGFDKESAPDWDRKTIAERIAEGLPQHIRKAEELRAQISSLAYFPEQWPDLDLQTYERCSSFVQDLEVRLWGLLLAMQEIHRQYELGHAHAYSTWGLLRDVLRWELVNEEESRKNMEWNKATDAFVAAPGEALSFNAAAYLIPLSLELKRLAADSKHPLDHHLLALIRSLDELPQPLQPPDDPTRNNVPHDGPDDTDRPDQ